MDHKYNIDANDNFNIWYQSKDPAFTEVNVYSNVPFRWMDFNFVLKSEKFKSIIKPINKYADYLIPPPDLIDITNNVVRLRQKTHADIYLLNDSLHDPEPYNVDRPWIRQYYQTRQMFDVPQNCFPVTYKFYTPWIIDEDVVVRIEESPESPFHVYDINVLFRKLPDQITEEPIFIEPQFAAFNFKKDGSHMEDKELGIIRRGSSMFDMVFGTNDIMIERIKDFYENYKVSPIQRR